MEKQEGDGRDRAGAGPRAAAGRSPGKMGTAPKGHVTGRGSQTTAGHWAPSSSPCTRVNGKTRPQVPSWPGWCTFAGQRG